MNRFIKDLKVFLYYKNPFYDYFLEKKSFDEISFKPQSLWTGNTENGNRIIDGFLSFNGESVKLKHIIWKNNKASKNWNI